MVNPQCTKPTPDPQTNQNHPRFQPANATKNSYHPPMTTTSTSIDQAILDTIAATDPQVAELVTLERERQETTIELIASENHASPAVTVAAVNAVASPKE